MAKISTARSSATRRIESRGNRRSRQYLARAPGRAGGVARAWKAADIGGPANIERQYLDARGRWRHQLAIRLRRLERQPRSAGVQSADEGSLVTARQCAVLAPLSFLPACAATTPFRATRR